MTTKRNNGNGKKSSFSKMNYRIILPFIMIFMFVPSLLLFGQDYIDNVIKAIKSSDYESLSGYFNTMIELKIDEYDGSYSKTQAKEILKDFFTKNPPVTFYAEHNGSSKKGSRYIIGTYKTKETDYRVYILFKEINNKTSIHILQFDKK